MPEPAVHTIHTVLLEVAASDEEAWAQLDAALSSHTIEQACQAALRQWDSMEALHRIPRLEIDLGHIDAADGLQVQDALRAALQAALIQEVGLPKGPVHGKKGRPSVPGKNEQAAWQEIVLHYLHSGTLPWYAQDTPQRVAALRQKIADAPLKYLKWLQQQNLRRIEAVQRAVALAVPLPDAAFVSLFADVAVAQWVQGMAAKVAQQQSIFTWLQAQVAHPLGLLIWEHLLQQQSIKQWVQSLSMYMKTMEQQGGSVTLIKQLYTFTWQWLQKAVPDAPARKALEAMLEKAVPRQVRTAVAPEPSLKPPPSMAAVWQEIEAATPAEEDTQESHDAYFDVVDAPDTQWVSNAGLVLLNPAGMLAMWREQGWVQGKAITDKQGLRNICLWMHCLVWGAEKPPMEYDLLLPRIWCQVPRGVHIPLLPAPNEALQQLANDYLQRIIAAWPQLKNTSPDGLRQGFLQRRGVLQPSPAGWQLQVEGKAQDILLQYLPWTYSIIKLPWMDKAFYTQWNTGT